MQAAKTPIYHVNIMVRTNYYVNSECHHTSLKEEDSGMEHITASHRT